MSDTKYRVIADGNIHSPRTRSSVLLPVRYQVPRYSGWKRTDMDIKVYTLGSDTKYRVIADGNPRVPIYKDTHESGQIPSTAL